MHKSATKCNETIGKWCKNKHGASKIIDTLETYQATTMVLAEVLLLVHEVEMQSVDKRHTFGRCPLHL
jgi:hypothetical protein